MYSSLLIAVLTIKLRNLRGPCICCYFKWYYMYWIWHVCSAIFCCL